MAGLEQAERAVVMGMFIHIEGHPGDDGGQGDAKGQRGHQGEERRRPVPGANIAGPLPAGEPAYGRGRRG